VKDQEEMEMFINFLTKLVMHNLELSQEDIKLMALAIVSIALNKHAKIKRKKNSNCSPDPHSCHGTNGSILSLNNLQIPTNSNYLQDKIQTP
jgi:hypothetical protein